MGDLVNNWADLPHHLLDLIIDMIDCLDNLTCFGSVCSSWRCVYIQNLKRRQEIIKFPLLMINNNPLPPHIEIEEEEEEKGKQYKVNVEEEEAQRRRRVYSVATNNILSNLRLQVPPNFFCFGSSNGWLVTVPTHDEQVIYPVTLLNPFLSPPNINEIQLPSLQMFPPDPKYDVIDVFFALTKVVVSVNPASSTNVDYTVMAIFGDNSELAYWKPGDTRWTAAIQTVWVFVSDVIFHGHNQFFSVDHHGVVMSCDVSNQKIRMIKSLPPGSVECTKKYIIESLGHLFQVHRLVGDDTKFGDYNPNDQQTDHWTDHLTHWTKEFHVFRMDCQIEQWDKEDEGFEPGWIQVNSLDDQAFFRGHNASISRSAAQVAGVKPNCIYFTDDWVGVYFTTDKTIGTYDMGVYCVEDKRFERYNYPMVPNGAPIWVEPTLGELKTLLKQI